MYFDQFYYLSKCFCASPCRRNSKNNFTADTSNSHKIRFVIYTLSFCFLSLYIRIYASIQGFLNLTGYLTLKNYIFLANAALTTFLIILQVFIKRKNAVATADLNNDLKSVMDLIGNRFLLKVRRIQFVFLIFIVVILLFINSEVHSEKINIITNFINETFIEVISFVDVFEYFNSTMVVLLGFNCIRKNGLNDKWWGFYLKLLDLSKRINEVQAVGISATVVFIFLWITFDAYVFFGILITGEYTEWRDFIRCAPWVILHSLKLIILLAIPGICICKGEGIKTLIFHNVSKRDVDKALQRYFMVINKNIRFSAYNDWFQLNYILALSMFGTIMTYLIILYQFTNISI